MWRKLNEGGGRGKEWRGVEARAVSHLMNEATPATGKGEEQAGVGREQHK